MIARSWTTVGSRFNMKYPPHPSYWSSCRTSRSPEFRPRSLRTRTTAPVPGRHTPQHRLPSSVSRLSLFLLTVTDYGGLGQTSELITWPGPPRASPCGPHHPSLPWNNVILVASSLWKSTTRVVIVRTTPCRERKLFVLSHNTDLGVASLGCKAS